MWKYEAAPEAFSSQWQTLQRPATELAASFARRTLLEFAKTWVWAHAQGNENSSAIGRAAAGSKGPVVSTESHY